VVSFRRQADAALGRRARRLRLSPAYDSHIAELFADFISAAIIFDATPFRLSLPPALHAAGCWLSAPADDIFRLIAHSRFMPAARLSCFTIICQIFFDYFRHYAISRFSSLIFHFRLAFIIFIFRFSSYYSILHFRFPPFARGDEAAHCPTPLRAFCRGFRGQFSLRLISFATISLIFSIRHFFICIFFI